jgi:hypothetical protein
LSFLSCWLLLTITTSDIGKKFESFKGIKQNVNRLAGEFCFTRIQMGLIGGIKKVKEY